MNLVRSISKSGLRYGNVQDWMFSVWSGTAANNSDSTSFIHEIGFSDKAVDLFAGAYMEIAVNSDPLWDTALKVKQAQCKWTSRTTLEVTTMDVNLSGC